MKALDAIKKRVEAAPKRKSHAPTRAHPQKVHMRHEEGGALCRMYRGWFIDLSRNKQDVTCSACQKTLKEQTIWRMR